MGIVKVPVVTVFAIEDPEIKPVIPDPRIAALAGPPRIFPTIAKANLKNIYHHLLSLKELQIIQIKK